MKRFLFLLLMLGGFGAVVVAQPNQTIRAELPLERFNSSYEVFPRPDSSVIVLNQEPPRQNTEFYTLFRYNEALVQIWKQPMPLPRGNSFLQAHFESGTGYFIFETYIRSEYLLVRVNLRTGAILSSKHLLPEKTTFQLSEFRVLRGTLFLTGFRNNHLTVLRLEPESEQMAIVPAIYNEATSLSEFYADTATNRLEFIMTESNGRKARLQVKRLDKTGKIVSTNFLQYQRNSNLLSARLGRGDSLHKLIAGTYSLRDFRYAQGFFTGYLQSSANQQFQFYDFTGFQHYFEYLKPTRKARVQNRISRLRENKKEYFLRHRVLLHPLIPFQNGYVLVGEMYYPHYQNTGGSNRIFDGYQFFQTIVAAFDKEGKLRWENSFPIKNTLIWDLKETVSAGADKERVYLSYPEESNIRYKVITGGASISNDSVTTIKPALPQEKLLSTDQDAVLHWYGNHFLAIGNQDIRGLNGRRRIYYLNKLSF